MVLPVIADHWLVTQRVHDALGIHEFANVFCIGGPTGSVATDVTIANDVAAAYNTAFAGILSTTITLGLTVVTKLDGTSPTIEVSTPTFGASGTNAGGHELPQDKAFGITWRTAVRGKRHRGRSYIPGVRSTDVVNEGQRALTTPSHTGVQNAAVAFLTALAASTPILRLTVLSRRGGFATDVNGASANIGVVEQRRRYERVARH